MVKTVKECKNIIRYSFNSILGQRWFLYFTFFLLLFFNFSELFHSGVLISGGEGFNRNLKYELIMNNYAVFNQLYGILVAICLAAGLIGVDVKSKNIYVIFSAVHSKRKYYVISLLTGAFIYVVIHTFFSANCLLIMHSLSVQIIWAEFLTAYAKILLNALVYFTFTAFFSILLKGYRAIIAGILGYCYYYLYSYNMIPFVNGSVGFELSAYKNILSCLLPVTNIYIESVTDPFVYQQMLLWPIGLPAAVYQIGYCVLLTIFGAVLTEQKNY